MKMPNKSELMVFVILAIVFVPFEYFGASVVLRPVPLFNLIITYNLLFILFVIAAIGIIRQQEWARRLFVICCIVSLLKIILFSILFAPSVGTIKWTIEETGRIPIWDILEYAIGTIIVDYGPPFAFYAFSLYYFTKKDTIARFKPEIIQ